MKLIAVLLLAGVSLCAGALRSSALHARCTALESFLRLVTRCAGALQYLSPELIPLLRDLGDVGVLDPFVHRCLELCADRDFHTAWHGALPALPRRGSAAPVSPLQNGRRRNRPHAFLRPSSGR